ncbi:Unknown protein [Striga hermonthica]|uniref:Uncharacterized protein n=1 Tax=Striga hermonthica TaxID=68872 RepID=A0A9N7RHQ4_STRHE|nr:Unknown protein [Striga hermonthica]
MPQQNMNVGNENCLPIRCQDKIRNIVKVTTGADKMMVAPGSLGSFLIMKEQLRTNIQLSKQNGLLNQPVDNSQKPPAIYSRVREKEDDKGRRFGLVDEDEDFPSSGDDYVVEEQVDSTRLANNINENTQAWANLELDAENEPKKAHDKVKDSEEYLDSMMDNAKVEFCQFEEEMDQAAEAMHDNFVTRKLGKNLEKAATFASKRYIEAAVYFPTASMRSAVRAILSNSNNVHSS